jgi:hypothetical protein
METVSSTIPGREVSVCYGDSTLRVYLDMGVGIGGDKWPAADMFCNLILQPQWKSFFTGLINGKRVLELGSGNAVVGALIDKSFEPEEVYITDLASHMKHIERNIALNGCNRRTVGVACDWNATTNAEEAHAGLTTPFDVILALECVYREDLYLPLIRTIKRHCHTQTVCFLGSTRQFTKPSFFRLLTEHGLAYKKLPGNMLPEHLADPSIGLFVLHLT